MFQKKGLHDSFQADNVRGSKGARRGGWRAASMTTGARSASSARCGGCSASCWVTRTSNDHDKLRDDSLLALAGDDLTGKNRGRERGRGHPLAKTLNRFEPGVPGEPDRYKKVIADTKKMDDLPVDLFLKTPQPKEISSTAPTTRCTATRGRFFHGRYGCYCYMLPYVVCGNHVLCSRLRPSNVDGAAGRNWCASSNARRWPKTKIVVRGDSGSRRDAVRRQQCRLPVRLVPQRPPDGARRQAVAQVAQPLRFGRQGAVLRLPLPDTGVVEPRAAGSALAPCPALATRGTVLTGRRCRSRPRTVRLARGRGRPRDGRLPAL